jgi:hypothetical protein
MNESYKLRNCILLIVATIFSGSDVSAQAFEWVKSFGGVNKDKGKELGVDVSGSQYVGGFFTDEITLGTTTLEATGVDAEDEDIFITKIDASGNPVWAHSFGNGYKDQGDYPFGLGVNENGFCAATGKCFKYVKLDNGDSLSAYEEEDMWLITYDPDGNLNWVKVGGGVNTDYGTATYVDAAQNVYCAGNFNGPIDFYGDSLIAVTADPHVFIAKYAWDGTLTWVKTFSSGSPVNIHDLKLDVNGNIYVGGNFTNSITFGSTTLDSYGDADGFITKLDPSGNVLWATSFGSSTSTSDETATAIALDELGNCYATSTFAFDCNYIGGHLQTSSAKNVMVAGFDPSGIFLWATALRSGPGGKFSPITLSLTAEEAVLVTGIFTGVDTIGTSNPIILEPYNSPDSADAFIASIALDGSVNWASHVGGPGNDGGFGLAGNHTAFGYATGNFRYTAQFATINLVSNGISDIWIAKFHKTTVGISSVSGSEKIEAFPNPFTNQLVIGLPQGTSQLLIFNALGQVVLHHQVAKSEGQLTLEPGDLAPGVYTIQLKGDYGITTGKIEKQAN